MDLKSLFNLDPTKYGVRPGAGSFKRVTELGQKPISLADLLGDLKAPTVPENIPTVNPIDTDAINSFMQTFGPAKGTYDSTWNQVSQAVDPYRRFDSLVSQSLLAGTPVGETRDWANYNVGTTNYRRYQTLLQGINSFSPYRSTYTSGLGQYNTYKPQIDTYNSEVSAYKSVVDPFNAELTAYNTEAQRRAGEQNTALVNPARVDKETSQTTGDRLAESQLYSEDLHNMMIDRISAQPVMDEISSLFSRGNK